MLLGIDIDGVIANMADPIFSRWGYPSNPNVYSLYEAYPNITGVEITKLLYDILFYQEMTPISGARWALGILQQNWKIMYVTTRPISIMNTTYNWLRQYDFPNYKNIHFADPPNTVRGLSKAQLLVGHGCNYLVDDNPDTAVEFAELGGRSLLFWQSLWPYADNYPIQKSKVQVGTYQRIFTVDNWREVVCQLNNLRGDKDGN